MSKVKKVRRVPRLAAFLVGLVLLASFFLSAATWVMIARMAGFDGGDYQEAITRPLTDPSMSWAMPLVVDAYLTVALILWVSPVPDHVAAFARKNTYAAAAAGVVTQSAFHALTVADAMPAEAWRAWLAGGVGALPPGVAALAVHMVSLLVRKAEALPPPTASPGTVVVHHSAAPHSDAPAPVTHQDPIVVQASVTHPGAHHEADDARMAHEVREILAHQGPPEVAQKPLPVMPPVRRKAPETPAERSTRADEAAVIRAVELVIKDGLSIRAAALQTGASASTVGRRIKDMFPAEEPAKQ